MEKLNQKKKFTMPETYVLIFYFLIFAAVLTYIIPAGEYTMITDEATGSQLVDPNSFHNVEKNPTSFFDFIRALPKGMNKGSSIIFFVLLIGGFFQIINDTGSIDLVIDYFVKKLGEKSYLVIPAIMICMSILGAFGIIVNAVVAFIPIGMILAKKLKMDPLIAVCSMYLAAFAGFGASFMAATNVQVAQAIAQLPPLSGLGFRLVIWAIITTVTILFVMKYALNIRKDISNSILEDPSFDDINISVDAKITYKNIIVMILLFGGIIIYAIGSVIAKWDLVDMSGIIFIVALVSGLICNMTPNEISKSFINGCKGMVYAGFAIGLANAITIVLTEGKIIHTIIYGMSQPLSAIPSTLSAVFMFIINIIFNFFVPSNSGQAAIVMPLMAPLADVLGITRQVSVLAYQYGAGFCDIIIPTSGVLMASLGVAKVPFQKWIKFVFPLFLMWTAVAVVGIVVAVMIGYH